MFLQVVVVRYCVKVDPLNVNLIHEILYIICENYF